MLSITTTITPITLSPPLNPPPPHSFRSHSTPPQPCVDVLHECLDASGCLDSPLLNDAPHADFAALALAFRGRPALAIVTMLREPVSRAHSEYLHVRRMPCHGGLHHAWDYTLRCNASLGDFLAQAAASNRMTRMLAGTGPLPPDQIYASQAQMLAAAARNLRRLAAFGIAERPDETGAIFSRLVASASPALRGSIDLRSVAARTGAGGHTHTRAAELTDAETAALRASNALDLALYADAVALFNRRAGGEALPCKVTRAANATLVARLDGLGSPPALNAGTTTSEHRVYFGQVYPPALQAECDQLPVRKVWAYYQAHHGCALSPGAYRSARYRVILDSREIRPGAGLGLINAEWRAAAHPQTALYKGRYVVALGGSATMGAFSPLPWTLQLEALTGLPVVTVAYGGTAPALWTYMLARDRSDHGRVLRTLVRNAGAVVLEATSARTMGLPGAQRLCFNLHSKAADSGALLNVGKVLKQAAPDAAESLLRHLKTTWIREHRDVLEALKKVPFGGRCNDVGTCSGSAHSHQQPTRPHR